jgi:hypothetical protein
MLGLLDLLQRLTRTVPVHYIHTHRIKIAAYTIMLVV